MCWAASQLTHCGRECSRATPCSPSGTLHPHTVWGPGPHTDLPRSPVPPLPCCIRDTPYSTHCFARLLPITLLRSGYNLYKDSAQSSPHSTHCSVGGYFLLCTPCTSDFLLHTVIARGDPLPPMPQAARNVLLHTPPYKPCLLLHALLCAWDLPAPVISVATYSTHSSR